MTIQKPILQGFHELRSCALHMKLVLSTRHYKKIQKSILSSLDGCWVTLALNPSLYLERSSIGCILSDRQFM